MLDNIIDRTLYWFSNVGIKGAKKRYFPPKVRIQQNKFREVNQMTSQILANEKQMLEWQKRYEDCLRNNSFDPKIYSRPPKNIRGFIFSTVYHSL